MKKVKSTRAVSFPTLGWSIEAGEVKELPSGNEAQEAILAHDAIEEVISKTDSKK